MVFDAGKAAGWSTEGEGVRVDHIGFGVVTGDDGKRLKTRSGETVKLIDLLDEAPRRMEKVLLERAAEGKTPLSPEEIKQASKNIGYAAVKYADLKNHPTTNYCFSYDRMLDTKGDTAVYLMFAYARLCSILTKAKKGTGLGNTGPSVDIAAIKGDASTLCSLAHPAERALAFELMQLGDVIRTVAMELMPNRLCDYLKELSVKCTDFVTKCHVLNPLMEDGKATDMATVKARLLLCESTRCVMEQCLTLLGISPLERI
jgi:arginyl-tRNA synthetase